jgi:hypothetical protein
MLKIQRIELEATRLQLPVVAGDTVTVQNGLVIRGGLTRRIAKR